MYISMLGTHMIHISLAVHLVQCVQANCVRVWSPCRRSGILQTQIRKSSALIQTGWSSASKQIVWVYGHHAGGSESCILPHQEARTVILYNIYIYIQRERERERQRQKKRERKTLSIDKSWTVACLLNFLLTNVFSLHSSSCFAFFEASYR